MVGRVQVAEEVSTVYESDSEDGGGIGDGGTTESISIGAPPVHPVPAMQGAFEESIVESVDEHNVPRKPPLDAKARRQKMIERDEYDETYNAQWRRKPQAKFHPLWKLMAQVSFGVHLLQQKLAKSDEEVVKILQKHVDEVDTYLEKISEDFELAQLDIKERINYLKLPLEHVNIFDIMLDDKQFRTSIIEGNEKIERICDRTARATNDSIVDVRKGIEAVTELSNFLRSIGGKWGDASGQTLAIYNAMRGNAEGWSRCFQQLQVKGNDLGLLLGQLGNILNEMSKRAGVASRRAAPSRGSDRAPSRNGSPAISTPTSRYSSLKANTDNKPLPRPPRSGSDTPLRLETPSVISNRPSSRGSHNSAHSPNSPHSHSPRTHSPLAQSPQAHSPQTRSPLAGSPRPQSPAQPVRRETAPFEGKFEQARAAPKPPVKKQVQIATNKLDPPKPKQEAAKAKAKPKQAMADEASDGLSALPQRPINGFPKRGPSLKKDSSGSVRRSGSLIKRLRTSGSKGDGPSVDGKPSQQNHQKTSKTSDLLDLFRVTGESPRNSRILGDPEESHRHQNKLKKKNSNATKPTFTPTQSKEAGKDTRLEAKAPHSPAPADSAYSAGDGDGDKENHNEINRIDSHERTGARSPIQHANGYIPPRGKSPGLPLSIAPPSPMPLRTASSAQASSSIPPSRVTSPIPASTSNLSLGRSSPRPHTPTGLKFALFPSDRPSTPSAASIQSSATAPVEGTSNRATSPLSQEHRSNTVPFSPSVDGTPGKGGAEEIAPSSGIPRSPRFKRRSSSNPVKNVNVMDAVADAKKNVGKSSPSGSWNNVPSNVPSSSNGTLSRKASLGKKKGSLGRLKEWMGRKGSPKALREVKE